MPESGNIRMSRFGQATVSWLSTRLWSWTAHSLTLTDIEPSQLQILRSAWAAAQDDNGVPSLNRFRPSDVGRIISNIALVDVRDGAEEARYRLVGSELIRLYGRDLTGRTVADCYSGSVLQEVVSAYGRVIAEKAPLFSTREFQLFGRSFGYRRLLLPMSNSRRDVTHVVLGLYPSHGLQEAAQWRPLEEEAALRAFREAHGSAYSGTLHPKMPFEHPYPPTA